MELFPELPDDVGFQCLVRVPYDHFPSVASVCKSWKAEIQAPGFMTRRRDSGLTRNVIVMSQARVGETQTRRNGSGLAKVRATPSYRLTVFEPESGRWMELPPVPGFSDGLPMFCQIAGAGLSLVVMGGLNPVTWEVSDEVFVYSFLTATWRRGADMPGCKRSFFACASSDAGRMVFVAGGHDEEKNALKSGLMYDVECDKWVPLPDMAIERDESKAVFHGGKFLVIGGYPTNMQGRFTTSAEVFDVSTWQWEPVQEELLGNAMCPRTCASDAVDRRLLMCRDADVVEFVSAKWRAVSRVPDEVRNVAYVTACREKLLVIGSPRFSEPHNAYALDLKRNTWMKIEMPEKFSGHVQSGCCLEM